MKSLKFSPHLIEPVLSREKTVTWRLFDDKNLSAGDELEFIDSGTGLKFAEGKIDDMQEKMIKDLTNQDLEENGYENRGQVMEVNKRYYGDKVGVQTMVKIIKFSLI